MTRTPIGHYRLRSLEHFEGLMRRLREGPVEAPWAEPSSYIDDYMAWTQTHQHQLLLLPPEDCELAILRNWLWYHGTCECEETPTAFRWGRRLARLPTLVVRGSLKLWHKRAKDKGLSTPKRTLRKPGAREQGEVLQGSWELRDWLRLTTAAYYTPYLAWVVATRAYQLLSSCFLPVEGTNLLLAPLLPTEAYRTPDDCCQLMAWGLPEHAKLVHLERSDVVETDLRTCNDGVPLL